MRIENDGKLTLHQIDLKPEHREDPPQPIQLRHFCESAKICAWYAQKLVGDVQFAMVGRLERVEGVLP